MNALKLWFKCTVWSAGVGAGVGAVYCIGLALLSVYFSWGIGGLVAAPAVGGFWGAIVGGLAGGLVGQVLAAGWHQYGEAGPREADLPRMWQTGLVGATIALIVALVGYPALARGNASNGTDFFYFYLPALLTYGVTLLLARGILWRSAAHPSQQATDKRKRDAVLPNITRLVSRDADQTMPPAEKAKRAAKR